MTRVLLLVEGQTEERFVRDVLQPHLAGLDIYAAVTMICTRREKHQRAMRGGHGRRYGHIRRDLLHLLRDTNAAAITTMIDYYGLPPDFPGQQDRPRGSCYDQCTHLESAFASDINAPRFLPNLIMHEFEALLFSSIENIQRTFPETNRRAELQTIDAKFATPEEINDSTATAPSKRLLALFPSYQKTLHGPIIACRTGLERIRERCPRFDAWLKKLEALSGEGNSECP